MPEPYRDRHDKGRRQHAARRVPPLRANSYRGKEAKDEHGHGDRAAHHEGRHVPRQLERQLRELGDQGLALPLLYWHYWRERLGRPEQGRLHRKQNWAFSDLLFPNSEGNAFQDQVVRDALRRVSARNKGPVGITPALIQRAFMQVRPDGSERYLG